MASTSGCSSQFEELEISDTYLAMGGLDESEHVTAGEADHATTSSSFLSAEAQIEKSKAHWSTLADQSGCVEEGEECEAEVSNVEEFKALQRNPTWGSFFQTFGYEFGDSIYASLGELVMGKKFADGAQAEIYDAQVTWWFPEGNEDDRKAGREYVLKVFKKGTFLKHLISQLPYGLLRLFADEIGDWSSPTCKVSPRYNCQVYRGTLLEDWRFAFLMENERFDLRKLIECNMESNSGKECGPFSQEEAEVMIYLVALG